MNTISKNNLLFNIPFVSEKGLNYIDNAIHSNTNAFSKKCQEFFKNKYNFKNTFLTSSCTDALEMAAVLIGIKQGDEVIIPSYTFVSSANPFIMRGANIVFSDSTHSSPNVDADKIESLITSKTKAIVVVHYGGNACEMDKIMDIATKYNIYVIEDAAHSIDAFYNNKPLGSFGHLSAFSFHNTKNITCGEGGMLVINDERLMYRAEIIFEKGTNRAAFKRGEVAKYEWMDIGSSYAMSEITAAYLFSQLEQIDEIQNKRKQLWDLYHRLLKPLQVAKHINLPAISEYSNHNAHLFYIVCNSLESRNSLMKYLLENNIQTAFHYSSLHSSAFYKTKYSGLSLENADKYSDCLLRLPLHYYLKDEEVGFIVDKINSFFQW